MSTNFLQWNPNANNQKNDTDWGNDTQRSGGAATNALFPSTTGNKLFFQLSTMVAALGQVISDYGHDASDANLSNLITAIKNTFAKLNGNSGQVFEAADGSSGKQVVNISQFAHNFAYAANRITSGYMRLPGGLLIQMSSVEVTTPPGNSIRADVTFPLSFATGYIAIPTITTYEEGGDRALNSSVYMSSYGRTLGGCSIIVDACNAGDEQQGFVEVIAVGK